MKIGEFEPESPIMNAGGVVKTVEDVKRMAATGVGAILAGSYTLDDRIGNSPNGEVVYYFDDTDQTTYNALGMPNKGIADVAEQLPEMMAIAHQNHKPFVLNLAPVSDDPAGEVITMLEKISEAGVTKLDAIELNAGCPNVIAEDGGRHELLSHHPELLTEVLLGMGDIANNEIAIGGLWVCISPFRNRKEAHTFAQAAVFSGVDVVRAFNTFPGGRPLKNGTPILEVSGNVGGISGPGKEGDALEQTHWLMDAREAISGTFEVVGSNGVYDTRSMQRRLNVGVSMVAVTTLFYESPNWKRSVDGILQDYAG